MNRSIFFSFAALSLVFGALPGMAQERMDMRKSFIEVPLKTTINPNFKPSMKTDQIRPARPVFEERVISVTDKGVAKVAPGKVCWHKDFDEAKRAAAVSGKPVLMFAMLGRLDDKFC
jgi:hypothetical protein